MNQYEPLVTDTDASRAVSAELLREIQEGKLNITQYARNREWWLGPQPDVVRSVLVPVFGAVLRGISKLLKAKPVASRSSEPRSESRKPDR
jgi:hypothetical protein